MTSEETQSAPGTTSKSDIQPPTAITPVAEGQRISNILQENSLLLVLSPQKYNVMILKINISPHSINLIIDQTSTPLSREICDAAGSL